MWWRNYSQSLSEKIKNEHISGSIVERFMQFVPVKCRLEGYRNILKLSCRPLAFTLSRTIFKKRPGINFPASL